MTMHKKRAWDIKEYSDLAEMCQKMTKHSWCLCAGFRWKSITLVNDSTSEDALQEFAAIKDGIQLDSITVSWCKPERLAEIITEMDSGVEYQGANYGPVKFKEHQDDCDLCA